LLGFLSWTHRTHWHEILALPVWWMHVAILSTATAAAAAQQQHPLHYFPPLLQEASLQYTQMLGERMVLRSANPVLTPPFCSGMS
jgi:hypothetical protein